MKMIRRSVAVLGLLLVLLTGGVVAVMVMVGGEGESAIEAWLGEELKQTVNAELKPDLEFDSLDYQSPRTVVLRGVRLRADDPDRPGQRVDLIASDRLTIELAELPRQGRPLKITSLAFDGLDIRLIAQQAGGLIGFTELLEHQPEQAKPLSEVLQITQITIRNGAITYDPRKPELEAMRFDQINTQIDIDQDDAGVYALALDITRQDVLELKLAGDWDVDAMSVAVESMHFALALSRENDQYLPPQAQAFCREHELTGALTLNGTGALNMQDAADSQGQFSVELVDGRGRVADARFPIERLTAQAHVADRQVTVDQLAGTVFDGQIHGQGGFALDDDMPAHLTLTGSGLQLAELMVQDDVDAADTVAGTIELQVDATAPLTNMLQQMYGSGALQLTEGRIARLPVISGMVDFIESSGDVEGTEPVGRDEGTFVFELRGDHAYFSQADILGGWFAMRGRGTMHFNDRLAMNINAGPLERVQSTLGAVGAVLGSVTDGLLTYRVTGPIDNLRVRPVPLGGIIGAPGD